MCHPHTHTIYIVPNWPQEHDFPEYLRALKTRGLGDIRRLLEMQPPLWAVDWGELGGMKVDGYSQPCITLLIGTRESVLSVLPLLSTQSNKLQLLAPQHLQAPGTFSEACPNPRQKQHAESSTKARKQWVFWRAKDLQKSWTYIVGWMVGLSRVPTNLLGQCVSGSWLQQFTFPWATLLFASSVNPWKNPHHSLQRSTWTEAVSSVLILSQKTGNEAGFSKESSRI